MRPLSPHTPAQPAQPGSPVAPADGRTPDPQRQPNGNHRPLPHLNLVIVGHVDHGKSTLIGRLLFDTQSIPDGKAEQIAAACKAEGMEFEYAFLLDALLEEQAQNITMDTTRVPFRTAHRAFTIIDAPGHKEFLKNMITGAATADAAVLIIDAKEGLREQTRRHGYLLSLLGLKHVVIAVNKLDLTGYAEAAFTAIRSEIHDFLQQLGVAVQHFVPIAAKHGEGVVQRSAAMPWYTGPSLVQALEEIPVRAPADAAPLRLTVQDVYRFDARRIIAGAVESGTLCAGAEVEFHPGGKRTRVKTIEAWPAAAPNGGEAAAPAGPVPAGRAFAITTDDELFIERGAVGAMPGAGPNVAREFLARVFWLNGDSLRVGDTLPIRLGTQEGEARVVDVPRILDTVTLASSQKPAHEVQRHEVGVVRLRTRRPLVFDAGGTIPSTGRFVLLRERRIAGGGVIDSVIAETSAGDNLPVTEQARERFLGHRGAVIWLTGLSGAGKSTLSTALEPELLRNGILPAILDGDVLRAGLCRGLTFSEADRRENIRRAAEAALLMAESGAVVITALISPYRADREIAAERCRARGVPFAEVYVNAPLAECERRDPKQLYRRARAGEIPAFTGISSPYEPPTSPALEIRTDLEPVEASLRKLIALALELARSKR